MKKSIKLDYEIMLPKYIQFILYIHIYIILVLNAICAI